MSHDTSEATSRRTLNVRRHIIGAPVARPTQVARRRLSDYPRVSRAHRDLAARLASPLLMGPPLCDELVAFVEHTFTEEEASVARHLTLALARTASDVARAEHRPVEEVVPLLKRLAFEKRVIAAQGSGTARRYRMMPVVPGMFESVLISQDPEHMTPWHRRFAELFEALFETGYLQDYGAARSAILKVLPVADAMAAQPLALPSDRWEAVLDRYESFAVGNCQCRMTMRVTGRDCGKPTRNCTAMGEWAESAIRADQMQRISKQEFIDIKAEAEQHGLVSWILNVAESKGQISCSCCGCCCHYLRSMREFNMPSMAAPPHFLPRFDRARCDYCGRCARACPTGALLVEPKGRLAWHLLERCIGCGLCAVACTQARAVTMEPVPEHRVPPGSWYGLITRNAPQAVAGALQAWWRR